MPISESVTVRRMPGQQVRVSLVRLPTVVLGDHAVEGHLASVTDLGEGFARTVLDGEPSPASTNGSFGVHSGSQR
ncbi:hypothetical protein [Krasilnikovia sp. MM14-A1259]|uniref:hypothetical protein n=1 Tax=Krasilnikovia sp. MM14-A1259 TaxID=3373539 RepID=UPI00380D3FBE